MNERIEGNEICVTSVYGQSDAQLACMHGSYYDRRRGTWRMPLTLANMLEVGHRPDFVEPPGWEEKRAELDEKLGATAAAAAGVDLHGPMPVRGVKPWPHQLKAYNMAIEQMRGGGGFGLLFDMGTGKTITAVGIAGKLFNEGLIKRVLVMAPSSVLPEWEKALDRYADFPYWYRECTGTPAKRAEHLRSLWTASEDVRTCAFAIINYESAWRTEEEIMAFKPDLVICDESQRIKSHTAKQSKFAHKVGRKAPYRLILSGTPLQNSPLDFFSQYLFLDPTVFGTKWYGFKARYAVEQNGYNGFTGQQYKRIVAYRNLEELTEKVHGIALRVENGVIDLPAELPPVIRYAELSREERRIYEELRDESIAELGDGGEIVVPNALAKLLRLQQITSGFTVDEDGNEVVVGDAKAKLFAEVVDDVVVEQGEKMVVFFRFIKDMKAIEKVLKEKGVGYVSLYGGTKQSDRAAVVDSFVNDADVRVFIGQLQASGTGIDGLQRAAHTAVFYSNSFNAADYEQAKARINRSGQTKSCVFMHLVCRGTVDERILEALSEKKSMSEMIVNRGAKEVLS